MSYLPVTEAAILAGRNERTIRRWIKAGKLEVMEIKGKYHIKKESLVGFLHPIQKNITENRKQRVDNADGHSADVRTVLSCPTIKMSELDARGAGWSNYSNHIITEGVDYSLSGLSAGMSEKINNNMSVNKSAESLYMSSEQPSSDVEMSDFTTSRVSDSSSDSFDESSRKSSSAVVSVLDGHLSTKSDIVVDNFMDTHDTLNTENRLSGQLKNNPDTNVGQLNRTINMSAYAVRLLDEKERVTKKFEEQNDFLKNELHALRKEVSAMRGVVTGQMQNQANLSDFLIESNKLLLDVAVKNQQPLPAEKITSLLDPGFILGMILTGVVLAFILLQLLLLLFVVS